MFCPTFYESPKTPSQLENPLVILSPTTCLIAKLYRFSLTTTSIPQPPSPCQILYIHRFHPPTEQQRQEMLTIKRGSSFVHICAPKPGHPLRQEQYLTGQLEVELTPQAIGCHKSGCEEWWNLGVWYQGHWNILNLRCCTCVSRWRWWRRSVQIDWMYESEGDHVVRKSTAQIARISLADVQGVKLQEAVMKTPVGSVL